MGRVAGDLLPTVRRDDPAAAARERFEIGPCLGPRVLSEIGAVHPCGHDVVALRSARSFADLLGLYLPIGSDKLEQGEAGFMTSEDRLGKIGAEGASNALSMHSAAAN